MAARALVVEERAIVFVEIAAQGRARGVHRASGAPLWRACEEDTFFSKSVFVLAQLVVEIATVNRSSWSGSFLRSFPQAKF